MGYLASENIEQFLDQDSLIFVVFQKTLDEYAENNSPHPVLETLQETYSNVQERTVGDIVVLEFGGKR